MPVASIITFCVVPFLGVSAPLQADTVFDNVLGPNGGAYGIFYSREVAAEFTVAANTTFTGAGVELVKGFPESTFNMSLYSNAAGVPGTLIEQFGTNITAPDFTELVSASSTGITLAAETSYWLVLSAPESAVYWLTSGKSNVPVAILDGAPWAATTGSLQFQIDGPVNNSSATPEPASISFIGLAFAFAGTYHFANRKR